MNIGRTLAILSVLVITSACADDSIVNPIITRKSEPVVPVFILVKPDTTNVL